MRKERELALGQERKEEEGLEIQSFLTGFYKPLKVKDRIDGGQQKKQQKYEKSNKPITKQFLEKIFEADDVIEEKELKIAGDFLANGKCAKLLFYRDNDGELQMMIGIDKIKGSQSSV